MKNISQGKVKAIVCGLPPLDLQNAFAQRIQKLETLRASHSIHLAKLDKLFDSLQDRAFRGELWDD